MATIEKYTGKDGLTYRITVYAGFDTQGQAHPPQDELQARSGYDTKADRKSRPEGSSGF